MFKEMNQQEAQEVRGGFEVCSTEACMETRAGFGSAAYTFKDTAGNKKTGFKNYDGTMTNKEGIWKSTGQGYQLQK
mgnify:CR=1 FL=1